MNKHFTQITTEDDLKIGDKIIIDDESLIIVMLHKIFILRYKFILFNKNKIKNNFKLIVINIVF